MYQIWADLVATYSGDSAGSCSSTYIAYTHLNFTPTSCASETVSFLQWICETWIAWGWWWAVRNEDVDGLFWDCYWVKCLERS